MKKICLIGGSGILGKFFAKKLSKNCELHVADIGLKNSKNKNLNTYYLDLNDEKSIDEFFYKTNQWDFVARGKIGCSCKTNLKNPSFFGGK